jgi:hypothetical protein
MAEVTFYHQERLDGGRRSGLNVDGSSILHGFVPGGTDRDPALAWFADVALETQSPPSQATALVWLDQHSRELKDALTAAAEQLTCGIDVDSMPWETELPGSAGAIRVSVSAMRRLTARHVGEELKQLASMDWSELFPVMTPQA